MWGYYYPFKLISDQSSAILFVGKIQSEIAEKTSEIIRNFAAKVFETADENVVVQYNLTHCYGDNGYVVSQQNQHKMIQCFYVKDFCFCFCLFLPDISYRDIVHEKDAG